LTSVTWTAWLTGNDFEQLFEIEKGKPHTFDGITWAPARADSLAAWEFYTELRTRITTQRLAYRAGDEVTALDSVYRLFELSRSIIKANSGCTHFATLTIRALNTHVRPFTAKWHREKLAGRLSSADVRFEFRRELSSLQVVLRKLTHLMGLLAGDSAVITWEEEKQAGPDPTRCSELLAPLQFGIEEGVRGTDTKREDINKLEAAVIKARREHYAREMEEGAGSVKGKDDAAIGNYGMAIERSPELPEPYLARAFVYSRRGANGDYDRAIADFKAYLNFKLNSALDSAIAYYGRGEVYRKMSRSNQQQLENALLDFRNATRWDAGFAPAWYNGGSISLETGKFDEAITAFDKAIDTGPEYETRASSRAAPVKLYIVYNDLGRAYYERWKANNGPPDDLQKAREAFTRAITLGPNSAEPLFNQGVLSASVGELTNAIKFYTQAIQLNPDFGQAYNARGEAREELRPADDAFDDFSNAVNHGYKPAHVNLARAYLRRKEIEQAIKEFDNALAYQPSDARAFWGRGEAYASKADHTRAIENFNQAINLDPNLIDAYYSLGVSYDETHNVDPAKANLLTFNEKIQHADKPQEYGTKEYLNKLYDARVRLAKLGYKAALANAKVTIFYGEASTQPLAKQVEAALRRVGFPQVSHSLGSRSLDTRPLIKYFSKVDSYNAFRVRDEVNKVYASSSTPRRFGAWLMGSGAGEGDTFGLIEVWLPPPPQSSAPPPPPPPAVPTPTP
jgi:tetratricopeptide (TPR) repeat protein